MIDFVSRCIQKDNSYTYYKSLKDKKMSVEDIKEVLLSSSVIADYGNNRYYKLHDIDFDKSPKSTFVLNNGKQISYVQYYKE